MLRIAGLVGCSGIHPLLACLQHLLGATYSACYSHVIFALDDGQDAANMNAAVLQTRSTKGCRYIQLTANVFSRIGASSLSAANMHLRSDHIETRSA